MNDANGDVDLFKILYRTTTTRGRAEANTKPVTSAAIHRQFNNEESIRRKNADVISRSDDAVRVCIYQTKFEYFSAFSFTQRQNCIRFVSRALSDCQRLDIGSIGRSNDCPIS
jgi:hypothetical protein